MILLGMFSFLGNVNLPGCLLRPGIWSVAICDDFIVIPYGSIAAMSFLIMTGAIVVVDYFARCTLAPDSMIASVFLLGEFGGVPIWVIN